MKYVVAIFSPPGHVHSQCFKEVAETVHHGLLNLGHESKFVFDDGSFLSEGKHIIFGANLLQAVPIPGDSIIYNLEQVSPDSGWFSGPYMEILKTHRVLDYSTSNIRELSKQGIFANHLPVGYVPELTRIKPEAEDIDVLFYGCINDRRKKVIDALRDTGLRVETLYGVYGKLRDEVIARSKIVLNLHYYEAQVFEIARVSYALANKKCVLSERGDPEGERDFVDGVAWADREDMAAACKVLITDNDLRKGFALSGFNAMRTRSESRLLKAVL